MSAQRQFAFLVALILLSTLVLVPIEKVKAAGVLDQKQTVIDSEAGLYTLPPPFLQFVGQTFKAGLTGRLTEVDLAIAVLSPTGAPIAADPVTVEIHSVSPTGALLGSSSLGPSAFPIIVGGNPTAFVAFIFSSTVSVFAGNVYAIVITTSNAPSSPEPRYIVGQVLSDLYPEGTEWGFTTPTIPPSPGSWQSFLGSDLAFKTFVSGPVGGVLMPTNKLEILTPYLALAGLIIAVSAVVAVKKRRD